MPAALTHNYLAHTIINQLNTAAAGTLTLTAFDGSGAQRPVQINQRLAQILQNNVEYFRSGMMAPDFYPDVFWGITISHQTDKKGATLTDYLRAFAQSVNFNDEKEVAFIFGWLAHLCADVFGHHLMTAMANGPFLSWFDLSLENKEIVRKHIGIEKFWDKQLLLSPGFSTTFSVPLPLLRRALVTESAPLCQQFNDDPNYPGLYSLIRLVRLEGWHRTQAEAIARYKGEGLRHHCPVCHATGQIVQTIEQTCPHCQGVGLIKSLHCPLCNDTGTIPGPFGIGAIPCPHRVGEVILDVIQDTCPVCLGAKLIAQVNTVACPICALPPNQLLFQQACERVEQYHRRREADVHATVDAYLQAHVCVNQRLLCATSDDIGEITECYQAFLDRLPTCLVREATLADLIFPEGVDLALAVRAALAEALEAFEALIPPWITEIKEAITSWTVQQLIDLLQLELTDQEVQTCQAFWSAQAQPTIDDFWPMYNGVTLFLLGLDGCTPDANGLSQAAAILGAANNIDGGDQPYATQPYQSGDKRYFRPIILPDAAPIASPLGTPTLLTPDEGQKFTNYPRMLTLTWQPVSDATTYKVEVEYAYRDLTGAIQWGAAYCKEVADTALTFEFVGSQPGRWRVTALDNIGVHQSSAPSSWRIFDYSLTPGSGILLPAPVLIAPIEGECFSTYPRQTTLTWQPVAGATGYHVDVEYGWPGPTGTIWGKAYNSDVQTTSLTFDFVGAQPGRWHVIAVDGTGAHQSSQPSDWCNFTYSI